MQRVTRDTMAVLERKGVVTNWVAVEHRDHTEYPHVHVIAKIRVKCNASDLKEMKQEHYRSFVSQAEAMRDTMRATDQRQEERYRSFASRSEPIRDMMREAGQRQDAERKAPQPQQDDQQKGERAAPARTPDTPTVYDQQREKVRELVAEYRAERRAQVEAERDKLGIGTIRTDADYHRWSQGTTAALQAVDFSMRQLESALNQTIDREERLGQASTPHSTGQLAQVQAIRQDANTRRDNAAQATTEHHREARAEAQERRADQAYGMRTEKATNWLEGQLTRDLRRVDREAARTRAGMMATIDKEERQELREWFGTFGKTPAQTREQPRRQHDQEQGR